MEIECPKCGSRYLWSPMLSKCQTCGYVLTKVIDDTVGQKEINNSPWEGFDRTKLKKYQSTWSAFANWFVFIGIFKAGFFFFEFLSARWDMLTYDGFFFILAEECVTMFMLVLFLIFIAKLSGILKSKRFYLYMAVMILYILGKIGAELLYYIGYALHFGFYTWDPIVISYFWLIIAVDLLFIISMILLGVYSAKDLHSKKDSQRQVIFGGIFLSGAVIISYIPLLLDIFFLEGVISNWIFIGLYILEVFIYAWGCVKVGILGLGQFKIWLLPKNI